MKDCDWRAPATGNRKPQRGCVCERCQELRAKRRSRRKVANMTDEQRERKNAAQRVENLSEARRRKRNAAQRVESIPDGELEAHREAGRRRSQLYRRRRSQLIPKDPDRVAAQIGDDVCPRCGARGDESCLTNTGSPADRRHKGRPK